MHRFRLIVGCVALGVALTGAACSSGGGDPAAKNPKAAVTAAPQKTGSGTVKMSLSLKSTANTAGLSGHGAYDFDKKEGRVTLTTQQGVAADVIITPSISYLKLPQNTNKDQPWVGVPTKASGEVVAGSPEATIRDYVKSIRDQLDPRTTLTVLAATVVNPKKVGTATIRGEKTTHVKGRVDLSEKSINKAPAEQRDSLRETAKSLPDGYPIELWFDHDGRVRRVEYDLASGTGAQAQQTTFRLDLFDFGGRTGITVPPKAQVGDATSLFPTTTAPATTTTIKKK
ncbi:MAG: hypothetical protein QOF21_294 [Actinomycetota bacterium]|jgi:hypothetical protein